MANTKSKAKEAPTVETEAKQGLKYDVKFSSFPAESSVKGVCSVTINDEFAIKGVKVVEGSKGLFMALPSYKSGDEYKDVCHPITAEGRKNLQDAVLSAYEEQSLEHASNMEAAGMTEEQNAPVENGPTGQTM